jgi:mRNA interferase MazF
LELPEEGRRPVCVLTRDEAIPALRSVVIASITRTIRDIPSEVRLTVGDGMPAECVISLDNLRTVPKVMLVERITTLDATKMASVCRALNASTGC